MTRTIEPSTTTSPPPAGQPSEQWQALGRLALVVAAATVGAILLGIGGAVAVIVAVLVMIMLHELGHYLTAKWAGMKVTEFFVGFGPRLWSVRKGETEYGIKAIPLGGYCKIIGMHNLDEVDPADEPRTYRRQSYGRRLSVGVAGSAMHFILAFALLWGLHAFIGMPQRDGVLLEITEIVRFESGPSPAQEAGLRPGDRIVAVDGQRFTIENDSELRKYIAARPGQNLQFTVRRDGREVPLTVTPADLSKVEVSGDEAADRPKEPTGFVGIRFGEAIRYETTNPAAAVGRAGGDVGSFTKLTVGALGKLFSIDGMKRYGEELTKGPGATVPTEDTPRFLSPVGLGSLAGAVADSGMRSVFMLLVGINLFVGIFNMLPLLPLDGGHVAVATYEAIRSRPGRRYQVDMAKLMPITYLVFLIIVFIGLTSLYLDIFRPLSLE